MSMSLNKRIAIRLFTVLAIFSIVHALFFYYAILHSFKKVEQQLTRQNVSRLQAAIRREGEYLGIFIKDWAQWDESYRFVVDLNDDFRRANLLPETLEQNHLVLVNYYDTEGRCVYSTRPGSPAAGELSLSALPPSHPLLNPDPAANTTSGILQTGDGPLLVASSRILTSSGQGPARGLIVMAKPVDNHLMAALSERLSLDVHLWSLLDDSVPPEERAYLDRIPAPDTPVIVPVNRKTQHAYCTITDLRGQPVLLACIVAPRDIYGMARIAQWLGSLSIALAGMCVLVGIFALMQKIIIQPVSRLTREVLRVRQQGNASEFQPVSRGDEIGILAREFSTTLHELDDARRQAVQANQAKSALLATISHEMRTPLNGIIGLSEVILSQPREERSDESMMLIITESERLLGLINELLENARIEAGKLLIDPQPFDLRHMLRDTVSLLQGRARQKGLDLNVEVDALVPPVVLGDSRRIRQIIINLAGNAIKFTDHGSITLTARPAPDADLIELAVTDTGPGIPLERQGAIFSRFADLGDARGRESTGLGTFISKELVTRMGGTIGFESRPGTGTRFWFRLPLPASQAVVPHNHGIEPSPAGSTPTASILLVEDDLTSMQVMLHHLVAAGHHVSTARCGREAQAQCAAVAFDLILVDVELPDMTGIDVTTHVRSHGGPNQATPMIAMTAHASGHTHAQCRQAGISHVLTKPVRHQVLLGAIAEWLKPPVPPAAPPGKPDANTPLDWAQALTEFSDDADALKAVATDFVAETARRITRMREAGAKSEWEPVRREAHAIKGGASNLCAMPLASAAADVEDAIRRKDHAAGAAALDGLERELTSLRIFMEQLHNGPSCGINSPV